MVSWMLQLLWGKENCHNAQESIAAACRILSCCIEHVSSLFAFFFFKYLPFTEESKGKSDLFGGVLKGTYHDEAAVIESQLELEVSLFVLLENTVEFSCIIPAGIFGNH